MVRLRVKVSLLESSSDAANVGTKLVSAVCRHDCPHGSYALHSPSSVRSSPHLTAHTTRQMEISIMTAAPNLQVLDPLCDSMFLLQQQM